MVLAMVLSGNAVRSAPAPDAEAAFDWFAYEGHDPVYQNIKAGPGRRGTLQPSPRAWAWA